MMLVSWLLLWIMLATLQTYLDGQLDIARGIGRGLITAVVAAVGFGVVLFQLYRGWPPPTFSFITHFVAWSIAYLPGLYVLLKRYGNPSRQRRASRRITSSGTSMPGVYARRVSGCICRHGT